MMHNFNRIFPNVVNPNLITQIYEDIKYKKAIGKITNIGERGKEVMYQVVADKTSANTVVGSASTWRNDVIGNDGAFRQISVPYYKIQSKFNTTVDSRAKFDAMGINLSEEDYKRKITVQAINQRMAYSTFFGFEKGQGLVSQATKTVALPDDTASNNKFSKYVPGELLEFLVGQIREMMDITYNTLTPIVIVGPQDAINFIKTKIVPLTNYQMTGAGTDTVAGTLDSVVSKLNGLPVEFVPCSYMKGAGAGNKDILLFIAPGLEKPEVEEDSTGLLNGINPADTVNTYRDFALELEEYQNPEINQKREVMFTSIVTPAYTVRGDALRTVTYDFA